MIGKDLSCAFDIACACAIYGKTGHTYEGCEELKDYIIIQKAYIQLCVAHQKIKEFGKQRNRNLN